jgi:glycosyltransferase involved in cell wall biosynthesis
VGIQLSKPSGDTSKTPKQAFEAAFIVCRTLIKINFAFNNQSVGHLTLKVDLVMWTYNGANTLPIVLSRINQVIPKEVVNQKLIVDDGSKDNTAAIAEKYGWAVTRNEGKGISEGANTALRNVQTEYFCSFEQDLYLAEDWWKKISDLILGKKGVAAACGIRLLPKNNFCYSIEAYDLSRRDIDFQGGYGKTLDNTIWNTAALRAVGGYPKARYAGIDTIILRLLEAEGFRWLVDYDVKSLHMHMGRIRGELKHYYFYGLSLPQIHSRLRKVQIFQNESLATQFVKLLKAPVSSVKMAMRMKDARLVACYPLARLFLFIGYVKGRSLTNQ